MAVIEGGLVVRANPAGGEKPRTYYGTVVPVAATTYADVIQAGEFYVNTTNGFLYEFTLPSGVRTFTRRDTV